jgi:RNA polymerase sigma-70 factor (ECF subfamily)
LSSNSFTATGFPALPIVGNEDVTEVAHAKASGLSQEPSDDDLIARIASGDREALALLFRRYSRLVWTVGKRIVRDEAEADDLLQDVFLLIARRASVFDSSKGSVRSLIVHITHQQAISRRRYLSLRQQPEKAEERIAKIAAPIKAYEDSLEARFGKERLRRAFDEMSDDQRLTFQLFFFEGYSLEEIAVRLGQSVGQVKHHYYRGLARLRRDLLKS